MAFGRRKTPLDHETRPSLVPASTDSDGKRRVFGEETFAAHENFLNKLGFHIDQASDILPDQDEVNRLIRRSRDLCKERRCEYEAALMAQHGCNNVRPFFIFAEGIFGSSLGTWLITAMDLLPYDSWNITYLPLDVPTARALGLPLHPQKPLPAIEAGAIQAITLIRKKLAFEFETAGLLASGTGDAAHLIPLRAEVGRARQAILDFAARLTPFVIQKLSETWATSQTSAAPMAKPI